MADQNKKEPGNFEKKFPAGEQAVRFGQEREKIPEKKEISAQEKVVADELRREIEMMEVDEKTSVEAEKAKEKISFLGEQEKINHLLQIAREKGLVFAIQVARKMNEPYLLDLLHDTLAREGFYKDFTK